MTTTAAVKTARERYAAALDRIVDKYPGALGDLNELDLAVTDWLVETEDGAVRRHGRQILAMIQGDLYQARGSMAPDFPDEIDGAS